MGAHSENMSDAALERLVHEVTRTYSFREFYVHNALQDMQLRRRIE